MAAGRLPDGFTLPELTPWNRAWFTSGSLAVQRCGSCAALQHPPEEVCHRCGGTAFDVAVMDASGTVHSHTVVHYAPHPALAGSLPYTVVLVALDEAPEIRVLGNLLDHDGPPHVGMRVVACWDERVAPDGERILLPQWRPARASR